MRPSDYVKQGWSALYSAESEWGREVSPTSDRAVKWCGLGAIEKAVYNGDITSKEGEKLLKEMSKQAFKFKSEHWGGFRFWQDYYGRTAKEVLALMKRAEKELFA